MKSRIVGSLSEFAKDEPSQKSAGFDGGFAKDTAFRLFRLNQITTNHQAYHS
jgi:hypothetical protein